MAEKRTILVVDDDKNTREGLAAALGINYKVLSAPDGYAALEALEADRSVCLMLSDVRMPGMDGVELLKKAKAARPDLICILLTAYGSVESAVEAMREGADYFIMKPVDLDDLDLRIAKEIEKKFGPEPPAQDDADDAGLRGILGRSEAMKKVFNLVRLAAPSDATVLIQGPSGSGKELVARAIHDLSPRAAGPFVAVECAALNENLLESELFGHEKGAFTDAVQRRIGRFEAANHGTLFLDEISEIPLSTQVKLLRVLESRSFERLGGTETISTDIRIVAACNRNLLEEVRAGRFRLDLYYRLNVVDIHTPALSERTSDIPLLAERFLKEFSRRNGGRVTGITPEAVEILKAYPWPGNVRELRNTIEKMVVLSPGGTIGVDDVPADIKIAPHELRPGSLKEMEKDKILEELAGNSNNITRTAAALGISRRTLQRKLKEWGGEA
jgi:DNA-binding NtrC family response regulator